MNKSIGLFFGSFNPIHIGHLIIANYMATRSEIHQVWFVVSPHNPLKDKKTLASNYDRLHLVNLGIGDNPLLKSSTIEFNLPQPSYTVDTLQYLKEKYPDKDFSLIMGGDNLKSLHKWKNYEVLLRDYHIHVYNRPGYKLNDLKDHPSVTVHNDVPQMSISASYIRERIKTGESIQYLVPHSVYSYLLGTNMYN